MAKLLKNSEDVAGEPIVAATMISGPGTTGAGGGVISAATRSVLKAMDETRAAGTPRPSPLREGQGAYLAVTARRVLLLGINVGTFSTKADGVLAEVARQEIETATFPGGATMIPLTIGFTDGTEWHFTVAKIYAKNARAVVAELTG